MKKVKGLLTGLLLLVLLSGAFAKGPQPQVSAASRAELKKLPGYVDFDSLGIFKGVKPKVEVFLDTPILRIMAGAASNAQEDISALLPSLKMVRVMVFEDLPVKSGKLLDQAGGLVAELKNKKGWNSIISVPENGETVDILQKTGDNKIKGFALLVVSRKEVVFINIAGDMDPELFGKQVGNLAGKFLKGKIDMSQLGSLLEGDVTPPEPEFAVSGTVKDAITGKPIQGARVSDEKKGDEPSSSGDTDAEGKYRYATAPEEHNIFAWAPGYRPRKKTMKADLTEGKKQVTLDFELLPE